ncbi:phosphatase PAP2 family protein [Williamsia deligens]|uniref:Phosphatase PAP2 family protein n=1 Tax=Williamsia deligens TaxID=321325 RepID=A0ABW3G5A2_9NOCA|nr:phosphatase PAP2 family protein [Williamsia deligens]MCP2193979.1 PAP2 superfamily protein [Williamsia deligens]
MHGPHPSPGEPVTRDKRGDVDGPLRDVEASLTRSRFRVLSALMTYFSRPRWWVEIAVIGGLYAIYSLIRNSVGEVAATAYRNAGSILAFEDRWHAALERPLNEWVHNTPVVADVVALQYATLHFIVTPAVLIWLFFRRGAHYRRVSAVLILTTVLALIGFYWYPTAPPRLLRHEGFVDVMSQTSNWGWWPESGAPGSDAISNQFAAMPSLHCAWAAWCGLALVFLARRRWVKVLGGIYPFTTFFVVMGSGNHFVLDVLAGLGTLAIAAGIVFGVRRLWVVRVSGRIAALRAQSVAVGSGAPDTLDACAAQDPSTTLDAPFRPAPSTPPAVIAPPTIGS